MPKASVLCPEAIEIELVLGEVTLVAMETG